MASKAIKGITVEIGGDTTKLGKAIDGAEKKSRSLQVELRQVEKLLQFDPTNTELLTQKQKILSDSVAETSKKLNTLKEAEKQVIAQFEKGEVSEEQVRALQREIIQTEKVLRDMESELRVANKNLNEYGDNNGYAREQAAKLEKIVEAKNKALQDEKNALKEAEKAHKEHEKAVKEAKEELKDFKDKAEDAYNTLKTGAAILGGAAGAVGVKAAIPGKLQKLVQEQFGSSKGRTSNVRNVVIAGEQAGIADVAVSEFAQEHNYDNGRIYAQNGAFEKAIKLNHRAAMILSMQRMSGTRKERIKKNLSSALGSDAGTRLYDEFIDGYKDGEIVSQHAIDFIKGNIYTRPGDTSSEIAHVRNGSMILGEKMVQALEDGGISKDKAQVIADVAMKAGAKEISKRVIEERYAAQSHASAFNFNKEGRFGIEDIE